MFLCTRADGLEFANRKVIQKEAFAMGKVWGLIKNRGPLVLLKHPTRAGAYLILDGQNRVTRLSEDPTVQDGDRELMVVVHDTVADYPVPTRPDPTLSPTAWYVRDLNTNPHAWTSDDSIRTTQDTGKCVWTPALQQAGLMDAAYRFTNPETPKLSALLSMQQRYEKSLELRRVSSLSVDKWDTGVLQRSATPAAVEGLVNFLLWWGPVAANVKAGGAARVGLWSTTGLLLVAYLLWAENEARIGGNLKIKQRITDGLLKEAAALNGFHEVNKTQLAAYPNYAPSVARAFNHGVRRAAPFTSPSPNELCLFGAYYNTNHATV